MTVKCLYLGQIRKSPKRDVNLIFGVEEIVLAVPERRDGERGVRGESGGR